MNENVLSELAYYDKEKLQWIQSELITSAKATLTDDGRNVEENLSDIKNRLNILEENETSSSGGTSGDGTSNYNYLQNKPQINGVTLQGNKTLNDLNIQPKGNYVSAVVDKGLSSNDFTNLYKEKLDGISYSANKVEIFDGKIIIDGEEKADLNDIDLSDIEMRIDNLENFNIEKVGDTDSLSTDSKTLVNAVNELKQSIASIEIGEPSGNIPTKLSQLENDENFVAVDDLPGLIDTPTKVSDLENDTGFITEEDLSEIQPIRDFSENPISLVSEVTGILPIDKIDISTLFSGDYNDLENIPKDIATDADIDGLREVLKPFLYDVDYITESGNLVFTRYDNTTLTLNLPLGEILKRGYLDETEDGTYIVFVLADDSEIRIPATALVNDYEGETTLTIQTEVSDDNKISAHIISGSITKDLLSVELQETLDNIQPNIAWLPSVNTEGDLSFSRSSATTPPEIVNIKGEKGDSGILTPTSGFFTTHVDENGDLFVTTVDGNESPLAYDEMTGNLYFTTLDGDGVVIGNLRPTRPDVVNGALILYVSPTGSDTTGDGTLEKPYQTIGKVAEVYNGLVGVSKCTINLMDGTYTTSADIAEDFSIRGLLIFKSYSNDRTKVNINLGHTLRFSSGRAEVFDITFNALPSIPDIGVCVGLNCTNGQIQRCKISSDTLRYIRGVSCFATSSHVNLCEINTMGFAAIYSQGGTTSIYSLSGNGNTVAYYCNRGVQVVSDSTIKATTMTHKESNGQIFGI